MRMEASISRAFCPCRPIVDVLCRICSMGGVAVTLPDLFGSDGDADVEHCGIQVSDRQQRA